MPRVRRGRTTAVTIGGERFYLTANGRRDGTLGEVFIQWGKQGSSLAGLVDGYAIALSVGLQHGVPLADLLRPGLGVYFVPNGRTDDPEIPRARSAVDYFCRRLAVDWLPYEERASFGVYTISELVEKAGLAEDGPREWGQPHGGESPAAALPNDDKRLLWEMATSVGTTG
jgi:ribonucleoside-diphosphate reductase alpha chain